MPPSSARLEPAVEPFAPDVAEEVARWMPAGAPVEPLALFRTLSRHVPLSSAMRPLGEFQLSKRAGLPVRVRELVIDRTCARLGATYEWGVHAIAFAHAAGLSDRDLRATALGEASDFERADALAIEMVDQLVDTHTVDADLWAALGAEFSDNAMLELLVLCGWYHIIGFVVNAVQIDAEPWATPFPEAGVTT